jgi:hypothetical protein
MLASTIPIAIGCNGLLDYYWNNDEYAALKKHLEQSRGRWITAFGLINQILEQVVVTRNSLENSIARRQYTIIKNGLFSIGGILSFQWWLFRVGAIVVYFPKIGLQLRKFLWKIKKGTPVPKNLGRSFQRW